MRYAFPYIVILFGLTALSGIGSHTTTSAWAKSEGKNTVEPAEKNFELGRACIAKGDWDGAIDAFLQSVYFARNNYAPQSYHWLAVSYEAKGNQDIKAIEAAKKYVEQSIKSAPDGHVLLAELYLRNNRLQEAANDCIMAIAQGGRSFDGARGHYMYGQVFERQNNLYQADAQYLYALGDQPWTYTEAWMALAELMMKKKAWGDALDNFGGMLASPKKLFNLDPVRIYRDMGLCLIAKGDHQGAMDCWHHALELNPADGDSHLQLAMMLDSEKHISSAIKEYKEYIRCSPDQQRVAIAKKRLGMLEAKLEPADAEYEVKPSPYQRKQAGETMGPAGADRAPTGTPPASKDSGF